MGLTLKVHVGSYRTIKPLNFPKSTAKKFDIRPVGTTKADKSEILLVCPFLFSVNELAEDFLENVTVDFSVSETLFELPKLHV